MASAFVLALPVPASAIVLALVADVPAPGIGTNVTVAVNVDATEMSCFSFSVEYDPAVLEYLGASEGPLMAGVPGLTFFSDDLDAQGRPQPNECLLGFETSVTGPGTVATLSFEVLDALPTLVTLRDPVVRDIDRLPIAGVNDAWTGLHTSSTPTAAWSAGGGLSAHPNPSSSRMSLVLTGNAPDRAGQLCIYDLSGRLVRELDWPAGAQSRGWDGRDREGRTVANGVYHARFDSDSRRVYTRIVRVR